MRSTDNAFSLNLAGKDLTAFAVNGTKREGH